MRYILIALMLATAPAFAQTGPGTSHATTSGTCSPAVTGNKNTFTINCGISKEQGQRLLAILNKILANQLDTSAVLEKLDEIHNDIRDVRSQQGWPHLNREQLQSLKAQLVAFPRPIVMIVMSNPDANKSLLAGQLEQVLQSAGWEVKQGANIWAGPPVRGLYVTARSESPAAVNLFRGLSEIFGKAVVGGLRIDPRMTDRDISIGICDPPLHEM